MQSTPASSTTPPPFADPTTLGLLGLAIACASLLPIAFGVKAAFTPDALRTTSLFCLLFGAGCQLIAGVMSLANKNMLGGTLFTTFSFNWGMNAWSFSELAQGRAPAPTVLFSVDVCFLVIFLVMTVAFGFASKLLFVFLLDIDVLYGLRIAKEVIHTSSLALPIAIATVVLMAVALYIAFALAIANAAGRVLLPIAGPLFTASAQPQAVAPQAVAPQAVASRPHVASRPQASTSPRASQPFASPDQTQQLPVLRPSFTPWPRSRSNTAAA
jgi:uncharacterized protein